MHVTLRKRHDDTLVREIVTNAETDFAADFAKHLLAADIAPEIRVENQRIVAEVLEDNARRRLFFCFWLFGDRLQDQFGNLAYR